MLLLISAFCFAGVNCALINFYALTEQVINCAALRTSLAALEKSPAHAAIRILCAVSSEALNREISCFEIDSSWRYWKNAIVRMRHKLRKRDSCQSDRQRPQQASDAGCIHKYFRFVTFYLALGLGPTYNYQIFIIIIFVRFRIFPFFITSQISMTFVNN